MPSVSRTNQYRGVNAHLHSLLQNELAGWETFHGMHIAHLAAAIDRLLPDGYTVIPEKSMQIRELNPNTGEAPVASKRPKPDLSILMVGTMGEREQPSSSPATPTLTLPATVAYDREDYLTAIVIREIESPGVIGKPVTWIELLSPTNKPPNNGYLQFREKRSTALENGITIVEIDYLHETRPTIRQIRSYADQQPGAFPYYVVITDPLPTIQDGITQVYGIPVDEPLPELKIPLAEADFVRLRLNEVYNQTYHSLGWYSYRVDYEQEPVNFNAYTPVDQQRIHERMRVAAEAIKNSG